MAHTNAFIPQVRQRIAEVVVGQEAVVDRVLIALLTGGHLLLQGVPGLAKTLLVKAFANAVDCDFQRVQCTIDILPSDIVGQEILDQKSGSFHTHKGPIFTNLLLVDEINRAAPKVQSALLEAMQERHVTIGNEDHMLPVPFLVIATQNPVEHSGTFDLPEAQLDRFMMCHRMTYPTAEEEQGIIDQSLSLGMLKEKGGAIPKTAFDLIADKPCVKMKDLVAVMESVQEVYVSEVFRKQCIEVVRRTRDSKEIELGGSPRAAISIVQAARARAFLHGRDHVLPEDLFDLCEDVILHRIRLTYEALAEGRSTPEVLKELVASVG
jgi:MoxR-like ATPase